MGVNFFTLLQLLINIVIFWQEIIKLFLKIAQFRIDVIDEARVNIILTSSQNHIEIYRYLPVKSKNILKINVKMAEAQNDAYSLAFLLEWFVILLLEIPEKWSFHSWKFCKICDTPWKFYQSKVVKMKPPKPMEIPYWVEHPWKTFLIHPWNFHALNPPCLNLFWNNPTCQ